MLKSLSSLYFLVYLENNGASRIVSCCEFAGVSTARGTQIADELVNHGYVDESSVADRRVRQIKISQNGRKELNRIRKRIGTTREV